MKKTIVLLLALSFILAGCGAKNKVAIIKPEDAKTKMEKFINDNLVQPGTKATIKEITEENGLYKVKVDLEGKEIISYLSQDGNIFFPQYMDIAEVEKKAAESKNNATTTDANTNKEMVKNDKPVVELFVMSHCPYGTQIEKGILPVVDLLGDKIDFKLKFVNYAMHGEKELNEEMLQYCINKEEPAKYENYLKCFLKAGNSADCLKSVGVNTSKNSACVAATDKEFKVNEKFADKTTWSGGQYPPFDIYKADNEKYGVQGSPTLVINGTQADSGRDSASLLTTICAGFTKLPAECSKKLSSETPAPGFGEATASGAAANANCGQ